MTDSGVRNLDHAGLVRPFLAPRWHSRYADILPDSARRAELLNKLAHRYAEILDWQQARPISDAALPNLLKDLGAGSQCYCLCISTDFDGSEAPLADALAALRGRGPLLLVCRLGSLAYFEPEYEDGSAKLYVLQCPSPPTAHRSHKGAST